MGKKPATKAPEVDPSGLVAYDKANGPFYISYKTEIREVRVAPGKPGSEGKSVNMFSADDVARVAPTTITAQMSKLCTSKRFKNVKMMAVEWPEPKIEYVKNEAGKDVPKIPPPIPLAKWRSWTYPDVWEQSNLLAKAFISLGLQDLDGVSILGFNAPFWALSAYAAVIAGGVASGIYPTDTAEQVTFKTNVADCSIVAVDTEENLEKYVSHIDEMPYLKAIMIWKDTEVVDSKSEIKRADGSSVKLFTFDQMLDVGRKVSEDVEKELQQRAENQNPGRCAFLIYTSGTTGTPKAVMVSHDNVFYQAKSNIPSLPPALRNAKIPWVSLSYLPLSHIAGMFLDVMVPVLTPGENYNPDMSICYARSYDLKMGSIVDRLTTVRPTFFFGVPRVYEKIAERMRAAAPKKGTVAKLGKFAKGKSLIAMRNQQLGGNGKKPFMHGAAKSILKKLHKKIGLDRAVMTGSAAAPMKLDVLEYWGSIGFYIPEAYGMSENTGVATAGSSAYPDWGCVGFPAAGTETKPFKVNPDDISDKTECPRATSKNDTSEECQGEICIRGRHVMLGYLANPKMGKEHEKYILDSNAKTIDNEGWLHSGDKGLLTETGMIKITGRYKELIIGAGGENIAPVPIEDDFKARCPAISNVVMIGDQRKYNVCLITLSCKGATGESPGTNKLEVAATNLTSGTTIEEASKDEKFIEILTKALKETNNNERVMQNNAFKIQKFTILPIDFSIETGELTPSLKLKRSVVEKKYAKVIDAMYDDEGSVFVQTLDLGESK